MADALDPARVLATPRLSLHLLARTDVDELWPHVSDPELPRLMTWAAHRSRDETAKFVESIIAAREAGTGNEWAIRHEGVLVGMIGFHSLVRQHREWRQDRAEIGYWCAAALRGRGFMTEAGREVLRFGFEELKLHKIIVGCLSQNAASKRVIEKLGFRLVGEQRDHAFRFDRWWDHLSYELLVHEWRP